MAINRSGFVAVVGPANAGKSTLVNRIVGEKISIVSSKAQTTRNRILGIKSVGDSQLILVDTPGYFTSGREERRGGKAKCGALEQALQEVSAEAVSGVDQLMLVIDAERALRQADYIDGVISALKPVTGDAPAVIALNKIDLVEKTSLLPLLDGLAQAFPDRSVELVPVSARSGDGIKELEQLLVGRLPDSPPLYPEDQVTDVSERFLAAEIVREKLFRSLEQELPYSVAVAVDDWKESGEMVKISAAIAVERESQKGIVIGKGGQMLKKIGELARIELEEMLGRKVYLQLFVKVDSNWSESAAGLLRAGLRNNAGVVNG